jgi:hypothetical protein
MQGGGASRILAVMSRAGREMDRFRTARGPVIPRLVLPALAAAILLFAAPSAFGAVYCVGPVPGGCSGTDEGTDLQAALTAAQTTTSTADQVLIADKGTPYSAALGFSYVDVNNANTVDIQGVGATPPVITLTGGPGQAKALTVNQNGSTVSGVTLNVPNDPTHSLFGLGLQGASAHDITVNTPSSSTQSNTGVQLSSGTLRNSTINGGFSYSTGVDARNGATVKDNTIFGDRGLYVFGNNVHVSRNKISSDYIGIDVDGGNPATLDNDLIDMRGGSGSATDGLFVGTTPSFLTNTVNASELTIRNGDSQTIGVEEQSGNANGSVTVNLTDSIIRGVGNSTVIGTPPAGGSLTLTADHDDYDQSTELPATPVSPQSRSESNILANVDPLFLHPVSGANGITGDYRLAYNSPVIDQGDTAALGTGETDLGGRPRIVDGAAPFSSPVRDLGAYEYQRAAPVANATATPGSVAPGQNVAFDGSGSSDVDGEALTYLWTFDDGATATGPTATHAFAAPGTHGATLTVTAPTGMTGTTSAQVSVTSPPGSTPGGGTPPATKKCKKKKHAAAASKKCKKKHH